ncbi:hypothetical protein GCK32_016600 [Trichostrongylus colubriformis]|uniref:Uncharacterized protein n=1 Tax=Trichostrongylus colubriformis TaxID=6319 RepID=A0AAN8J1I6_TRICO
MSFFQVCIAVEIQTPPAARFALPSKSRREP